MAWQIDPAHTRIQFSARHMMISDVRGDFDNFTGSVNFDEHDLSRSSVVLQIEAASVNTRDLLRDAHLKSPDFFCAEQYPYLHFTSKRVELGNGVSGRLIGDLTIKDITREVILDFTYSGQAKSPWGRVSVGFSAVGRFHRRDWGLIWNQVLETGGVLIGDEVFIQIDMELLKENQNQRRMATACPAAAGDLVE